MLNKHYDNWLDLSLDTKVVDCLKEEDRYLISLEDTVFFFESGGQKKDIGTINNHEVLDLIEKEGNFYHVLAVPLTGDVHLEVDKKHRMIQAQIHSASHLMCTLINKRFNAKTIAFFNDELEAGAEMGFETLEESTIKRIEELCNEYIRQDIPVEIMYPEYEEAIKHVSIKKADHDVLRAVKIGDIDYDMCACVHVPSLRYLQSFKIIRHEKTTRGYKIFFLVGDQLRNTYQRQYDILRGLSSKLSVPVMKVEEAFDKYNFGEATSDIMTFMSTDLSSFYLDINKDVLYCEAKDSLRRKQVQTVLYTVGETLLRLLNPILPFTMDEFNRNMPGERKANPQYYDYPKFNGVDDALLKEYDNFKLLRDDVLKALEEARNNKVIGSAQEAYVSIEFNNADLEKLFNSFDAHLRNQLFVVSEIKEEDNDGAKYQNAQIKVIHHPGHFCERCWNYESDAVVQEDGTYLCKRCAEVVK